MGTIKQNRANNILTSGKLDATDGLNNDIPASNIANASFSNVTAYPPSAGAAVTKVASDPPSPSEGQVWFNTTSNVLKQYAYSASWATGGNMGTARSSLASASNATQDAALGAGGYPNLTATEEYDGSSWTAGGALGTGRHDLTGAGTQTAGLVAGGTGNTTATEEYNGTSWTEVAELGTARFGKNGRGSQLTSSDTAITMGGYGPPTGQVTTEEWTTSAFSLKSVTTA